MISRLFLLVMFIYWAAVLWLALHLWPPEDKKED